MKAATKVKLKEANDYCDLHDKSTEFMIQYMMDFAGVSHETVIKYLKSESEKEAKQCRTTNQGGMKGC